MSGSEPKAILANSGAERVVDLDGLRRMLGSVADPRNAVFRGMREVRHHPSGFPTRGLSASSTSPAISTTGTARRRPRLPERRPMGSSARGMGLPMGLTRNSLSASWANRMNGIETERFNHRVRSVHRR
jgi:hypothetical protein